MQEVDVGRTGWSSQKALSEYRMARFSMISLSSSSDGLEEECGQIMDSSSESLSPPHQNRDESPHQLRRNLDNLWRHSVPERHKV